MWALCERGYLSNFVFISKLHGADGFRKHPELSSTGSMVLQFNQRLPKAAGPYTMYIDNLFTSVFLFRLLRQNGIRACGTTRASRSLFPPMLQAMKGKSGGVSSLDLADEVSS